MGIDVKEKRFNQILTLRDGRSVSLAEAGDPNGIPVFMLYGLGCSRYFVLYYHNIGADLGLRLLCPDRPGRGSSDHHRNRSLASYSKDILEIADLLGVYYFGLWGYSAGGAHALGCVCDDAIRKRLLGGLVVAGCWVPTDTPGSAHLHRFASKLPRGILGAISSLVPLSEGAGLELSSFRAGAADMDENRKLLAVIHRAMIEEAMKQGPRGYVDEVVLCCTSKDKFGFELTDVKHPVRMYHGRYDKVVPPESARHIAEALESCKYYEIENVSHQTIIARSLVEGTLLHLLEDITAGLHVDLPQKVMMRSNTVDEIRRVNSRPISSGLF